ncbi:hypothetical protein Afil01_13910 [Actinorhabdospora filicis]|uniref:Uncharacterized protein n=1 Tax=Actinorhabdospora filicis TaxID=1785913 RepID=A0A9W6SJ92_9ACTN|nr:hypothetical protein [Actinorhabdospora filicis]GLZ76584.1 hypothetical protein Afil01_13910 [Actinorhabdospora filicis]
MSVPRRARVQRWIAFTASLTVCLLLAWAVASINHLGPWAPVTPDFADAHPLPPGTPAQAPIGPGPATVTTRMPAGWYVDRGEGDYADGKATITMTTHHLAPGLDTTTAAGRERAATLTAKSAHWRTAEPHPTSVNGFQVIAIAYSDEPDEWQGVLIQAYLAGTVTVLDCAYSDLKYAQPLIDGCATALQNLEPTA